MEHLLTKKDLAKRWQISLPTVDNYIADGILTPIKNIPSIRFNPQYIAEIEGIKLEKHSPLEWRRIGRELEHWKTRAENAEAIIAKINMATTEVMYSKQKQEMEG
ncbi:histidine kinase [Clostridium tyrobutyricum]|uniref:histidine kinase n=1 Tax=Clostridium tyrobutyricum TaxID=1519 RepID=UPI0030CE5AEE